MQRRIKNYEEKWGYIMDVIFKRRSVRSYLDKPVEKEKIEKLLSAAMQAPSAKNQQPWEFLVLESKEVLDKLSNVHQFAGFLSKASAAIIILKNEEGLTVANKAEQDLGACVQNILLEATELELGTCWIGIYPDEDRITFIEEMFDMPSHVQPFAIVSIGYPKKEDAHRFTDRYNPDKVHYEKY